MMVHKLTMLMLCVVHGGLVMADQCSPAPGACASAHPAVVAKAAASHVCGKSAEQQNAASADANTVETEEQKIRQLIRFLYKETSQYIITQKAKDDPKPKGDPLENAGTNLFWRGLGINMLARTYVDAAKKQENAEKIREALFFQSFCNEVKHLLMAGSWLTDDMLLNSLPKNVSQEHEKLSSEELEVLLEDNGVQLVFELREKLKTRVGLDEQAGDTLVKLVIASTCIRACQRWHLYGMTKADLMVALERQRKTIVAYAIPLCEVINAAKGT